MEPKYASASRTSLLDPDPRQYVSRFYAPLAKDLTYASALTLMEDDRCRLQNIRNAKPHVNTRLDRSVQLHRLALEQNLVSRDPAYFSREIIARHPDSFSTRWPLEDVHCSNSSKGAFSFAGIKSHRPQKPQPPVGRKSQHRRNYVVRRKKHHHEHEEVEHTTLPMGNLGHSLLQKTSEPMSYTSLSPSQLASTSSSKCRNKVIFKNSDLRSECDSSGSRSQKSKRYEHANADDEKSPIYGMSLAKYFFNAVPTDDAPVNAAPTGPTAKTADADMRYRSGSSSSKKDTTHSSLAGIVAEGSKYTGKQGKCVTELEHLLDTSLRVVSRVKTVGGGCQAKRAAKKTFPELQLKRPQTVLSKPQHSATAA